MSHTPSILRQYETIARISGRMLDEARINNWDKVVALGEEYQDAVESLRVNGTLSNEDREARRGLLIKILDDDASIRMLARPELDRLGALLGNMKRQQTILHTYSRTIS
ncbi:flagellar protein FliT [Alcaligenaceae bacterium]|nr:flagellar protein FliT [Alcaligenaceae bacterium]